MCEGGNELGVCFFPGEGCVVPELPHEDNGVGVDGQAAGATRSFRPAGTSRAGMMVVLMWSVMMSGSTISWWAANSASTAVVLAMSVQVAWRREVVKACLTFRWAVLLLGVVRRMRMASSQKTWCMLCGTSFAMVRRAWYAALRLLGA